MQFNVLKELRQSIGSVNTWTVEERRVRVEDAELLDVAGTVTLLRTDRGLLVRVRATATAREACSRCLAEVACPVHIDFEEEYVPVVDANTGARVRIRGEADLFRIGADFVLDLREGLRQYFLMGEPLKPLCSPDCAGLCPVCGANLSSGPCGCEGGQDERWGALTGLKIDNEGS